MQESGVLVWFDPEAHYADLPATLGGDIHVESFDSSFFELHDRIDSLNLMRREKPPTLVVYVPRERGQTHNALAELVAAGVELFPGAAFRLRNTRLSTIARRTLETVLGIDAAVAVEKQVADGKLTLAELDRLAEQGKGVASGKVSLVSAPRIRLMWHSHSSPTIITTPRLPQKTRWPSWPACSAARSTPTSPSQHRPPTCAIAWRTRSW